MSYWRMQLHPDDGDNAAYYANQSIAAGFIGLGFATKVGDLLSDAVHEITDTQKNYVQFAKKMDIGDKVLIIVHHYPFAVVTVDGEYNYIRNPEPELGVWFKHFRRIKKPIFFSDFKTNSKSWEQYVMTDTISILKDKNSKSFKLIDKMAK
ncbi:MAG: hypothetical protein GY865_19230 [candidate division Zixibacteria bacterium]|nr:hypothetical protein [candidate division Zixibacteria bacterium]